jgi:hypothetical protein
MHMHLKGLLEVTDDEDDDAEADHALQGDDDNEKPSLPELRQLIEQAAT